MSGAGKGAREPEIGYFCGVRIMQATTHERIVLYSNTSLEAARAEVEKAGFDPDSYRFFDSQSAEYLEYANSLDWTEVAKP